MRSKIFITTAFICLSLITMALIVGKKPYELILENIPFRALSKPAQKQVECLAENIYFEALNESRDGQIAVALVTLNRLVSGNYGNDICGVVKQKTNIDGRVICQFSWYCDSNTTSKRLTIKNTVMYNEVRDIAVYVLLNYEKIHDLTNGATYYHADYVQPGWKLNKTTKIGRHIFYRNKKDYIDVERKEIRI
jgi:spore germination cell wall hydrolase CwlJ-like protein